MLHQKLSVNFRHTNILYCFYLLVKFLPLKLKLLCIPLLLHCNLVDFILTFIFSINNIFNQIDALESGERRNTQYCKDSQRRNAPPKFHRLPLNSIIGMQYKAALRRGERYVCMMQIIDWADKTHVELVKKTKH